MTLHWWMHWFWVTTLLITIAGGWTIAAPQSEELQHITTDTEALHKAIENYTEDALEALQQNATVNITDIAHPSIQWTPINASEANATDATVTITNIIEEAIEDVKNETKNRNATAPDYVKGETGLEGVSESRIVTEKPLSLETAYLQTRIPPNIESYRRVVDNDGGMDTGAIAGISFAALVLTALAGSTAFILYRRRYLNKPQTLNDKCSNPDSSGYLDDSTIRDNSEEMYSLDNDSFLNSLEAMTIQNYWTDTVKHTKL